MNFDSIVNEHFAEHLSVIDAVARENVGDIVIVARLIAKSLAAGGCIFWLGNGGSAADAQHLAAELVGRFKNNRRALRSIALSTDTSVLTCVANDYGYDDVFARQVEALGRSGDVLVGISTSGNSENVIRAFLTAKELGLSTVSFLGKGGGRSRDLADWSIVIGSDATARIQESHILIGHILCDLVEQELGLA
jgi:D-sedoheptulose 7-phosphate isomerase